MEPAELFLPVHSNPSVFHNDKATGIKVDPESTGNIITVRIVDSKAVVTTIAAKVPYE